MSKKIVYCISGLGADERVFRNLELEAEVKHVRWVKPLTDETLTSKSTPLKTKVGLGVPDEPIKMNTFSEENISSYAKRLAEQIDASQPFLLLGVGFTGHL